MISVVFNSETLGTTGDASAALSDLRVDCDGADEIVPFVAGEFVEAFERGNLQGSLSFTVLQQYGTHAEAFEAVITRGQTMERVATLDIVIDMNGVNKTLRMKNALRKPLTGDQTGISVAWAFSFTGGEWVTVASAAGAPDYSGGEFDSGDAWTRWYWGGTFGDGSGVGVDWSRELTGGTF